MAAQSRNGGVQFLSSETTARLFSLEQFQSIQSFLNLNEFMNNDDVRLLGVDADRTIVAMNELLDFVVGFFVNVHLLFQVKFYQ